MCGIFGVFRNVPVEPRRMADWLDVGLDRIRHRGPDGRGSWTSADGRVGLGHVRLSIIDLESGSQPMSETTERLTIVFNGEIYNYRELREELGAERFRTHSDTEVILEAFRRWGPSCVERLRGMFAFAIWDSVEHTLTLARDRFGIKPLYWAECEVGLVFASEAKALLPFLKERCIDRSALGEYLSFQFCLGDRTLFSSVHQLPAAHVAVIKPGEAPRPTRYWEVQYHLDLEHTEHWFKNRLRELLWDSVDLHLRADVEVGSYLSGGVDSSLLAAVAREHRPAGRFLGFNGRFLEGESYDESRYAQSLSSDHGLDLRIVDIHDHDFVDWLPKVIWHLDQPVAGPGSFPQYMVSREVGRHIKVVLGGQGGDEIFGGYARYLAAYFEQCIKGAIEGTLRNGGFVVTYESIIPNLRTLLEYKPMLREFWADGLFQERDFRYFRLVNRSNSFGEILAPDAIDGEAVLAEFRRIYWSNNVGPESYFDSMTHFDFKTLLPALLQVEDRMSMAHGVESRVPFLDHPLVEFAATIPANVKFRDGELKRLLRLTFGDRLPAAIRERKDKMGFPVPLNTWVRSPGAVRDFVADLLGSREAADRPWLRGPIPVDHVFAGGNAFGRNLWALLSLELWHRQFIDTAEPRVRPDRVTVATTRPSPSRLEDPPAPVR